MGLWHIYGVTTMRFARGFHTYGVTAMGFHTYRVTMMGFTH